MRHVLLASPVILAACSPAADPSVNHATANVSVVEATPSPVATGVAPSASAIPAPLDPPAPGQPGGLDNDTDPVAETPQAEASAQGAGQVVQRYYALIEAGRYAQAYSLWDPAQAGMTREAFVRSFARYAEYHANIGKPGDIDGAAGSSYVTVPVQPYGRLRDGNRPFNLRGSVTLRRVNDVPGSTAEQRRWRIYSSDIKPAPGGSASLAPQPVAANVVTARYRCDGGVRLVARFDNDKGVVTVLRDGRRLVTMPQQRAASGIWYRGGGYDLRGKGDDMTWNAPGQQALSCTANMP